MTTEDPVVLLVDDSKNDAILLRSVFGRAGFVQPLQYARDGEEAIAYLRGDGVYSDRTQYPFPTAVLLDLNMPRKNGFEVLEWIRQQPALKRLRVFILSTSSRPQDIEKAYDSGASSYLVKPGNLDGLMNMAKCLVSWLKLNHFAPLIDVSRQSQNPDGRQFVDQRQPERTGSPAYEGVSAGHHRALAGFTPRFF